VPAVKYLIRVPSPTANAAAPATLKSRASGPGRVGNELNSCVIVAPYLILIWMPVDICFDAGFPHTGQLVRATVT
jgi:hypothetical protein